MSDINDTEYNTSCSFCGKHQDEVSKLVSGPDVYICDECIELCNEIVQEEGNELDELEPAPPVILTPMEIKDHLDGYVIGQEFAKKVLSVAVHNHYKRIDSPETEDEETVELQKSNIILIGPTGSGKTLVAQTLARILNVPFTIADATTLTEAGYVGDDVENILVNLVQAADHNIELAERGIIYIDEIDKIARKADTPSITRDVSGEGVQQALLKIIEGTIAQIPPKGGRKHPQQELTKIDTTNILFICGGAFVGLDRVIKNRTGSKSMGFGAKVMADKKNLGEVLAGVQPEDLLKFGLIPEFVGRLPVIATMRELTEDDLVRILKEPKNALTKQYQRLFQFDNITLRFTEGALTAIAQKALKRKSGARGLRSVMEEAMLDVMYDLPSRENVQECVISEQVVTNGDYPVILYKNSQENELKKSA